MRKNLLKLSIVAMLVIILAAAFVACNSTTIQKVDFTITFDVDGENYFEIKTQGSEVLQMPTNPTKENYIFDGWYWDKDEWQRPFTANSLADQPLTDNMTVYAKWTEVELTQKIFTVSFNSMGGTAVEPVKVQYGKLLTAPERPTKLGYALVGWYKEADLSTKWDFNLDKVTEDLTLYAKWVDESDATGCEILNATDFEKDGNTYSIKVANSKEHFALSEAITVSPYAEWTVTSDIQGKEVIPSATVDLQVGDNTFYINVVSGTGSNKKQYTIKIRRREIYTVTYQFGNGQADETVSVEEDGKPENRTPENKQGYTFEGWLLDDELWQFDTDVVTKTITLVAKWNANGYEVTLDSRDGSEVDAQQVTYDATFNFPTSDKKGYTFQGWETAEGVLLTDTQGAGLDVWKNTDDELTLYAKWQLNTYTITYHGVTDHGPIKNTLTNGNPAQYTVELADIELSTPTSAGYTFEKWYEDAEFQTPIETIDTARAENLDLYAKFALVTYTAKFYADDNKVGDDVTFNVETESLEEPSIPDKTGYTGEWADYTIGAQDLTINAEYTAIVYDIEYLETKGARNPNRTTYTIEDSDITLSAISADGYNFLGWFVGEQKVEKIDGGSFGKKTFTAHWSLINYNITYTNTKSAENSNLTSYNIETPTFELTDIEVDGYDFDGWYDETGKPIDKIEVGSTGHRTIEARWTAIVYDIEYLETKGARNPNRTTYTIEDSDITLSAISADGYNFLGWFDEEQDGEHAVDKIEGGSTGKRTFTAHWSKIGYTLTLEYDDAIFRYADGDSNPEGFDIESDFELKGLEAYAVGYHFTGWFTEKNNGEGEQVTAIKPGRHENLTLYAHYGLEEYTITYHNVDGIDNTNATTYTVLSEEIIIHALSKNGYDFDGWFSDEDCLTEADTTIETGSHGNLNFYAKWTPIQYPLTFQLAGGHYEDGESNKEFYTIEDSFTFVEPKYEGYRFDGWYTLAVGGDRQTGIEEGTTGNKTFYAHWTRITTLHFDSKNGSPVDDMQVPAGDAITAPLAPTRDYYTFAYWCSDDACEHEFTFDKMPENDQTLYAKWTPIEYTIHYELYGGDNNEDNPETYNVESGVTLLPPTKTGYTFNAWFKNAQFTGETVEEIPVGSHDEITLYASFTINQYTMRFDTHDGTTVDEITQNYDTLITPPGNPAKTGYSFAGWYKDASYQEKYTIGRMPAENLTLHAKWELVEYDIHYNLDNGDNNALNPETYNIESNGVTLHDPTKTGYTFKGWYSDSRMETQIESIPAGSFGVKEVYAKWEVIEYDISYDVPEGTVNNNIIKYSIETDITKLEDGELLGHTFVGWFSDSSYETQVTEIGGGETGELTLYGKFTPNEYTIWLDGNEEGTATVSFDTMGGNEEYDEQHITEEDGLEYPGNPTKDGFLFGGWYANRECEGTPYDFTAQVGGNVTLYAKWISYGEANTINVGGTATVTLNGKEEIIYRFVPVVSGNISITTQGDIDTLGMLYLGERQLKQNDDDGNDKNFLIVYNVTAGQLYEIRVRAFSTSATGDVTLSVSGSTTVPAGGRTLAKFDSKTVTFGESFELPVRTKEDNQKFLGWQDASGVLYTDEHGDSVKTWDKGEDTVLYSKWEKMEYTVTFNTSGGDNVNDTNSVTLEYGARLDLNLYVTTRATFSFLGWYESTSASSPYDASTMPDHDITLYAKWASYGLGSIKYDEDKLAISVHDTLNAELFSAICVDTNGELADITVAISGALEAGNTVIVRIDASKNGKTKNARINNVKVYGDPSITVNNLDKDYINPDEFTAEAWGASGTDTYDQATTINVRLDGEHEYGEEVTVVIESIDPAGNITSQSIENVKYYGAPVITYNENKNAIGVDNELNAELFEATAQDSFGETLDVSVTLQEGDIIAGQSVTLRISATDSKGNVTDIDVVCAVYARPTISSASKLEFREDDVIEVDSLVISAEDTYHQPLEITLTHTGEQVGGTIMIFTATVTDAAGNVATREYRVKIYGAPTITYTRTDIKDTEDATTSLQTTVSFDLNGASGDAPAPQTVTQENGLTYPEIPTRTDGNYVFGGWYEDSSCQGVPFDFSADVTTDVTLYAKWVAYSGAGYIAINDSKQVYVYSRDSSSNGYYAFVPLVDGEVEIYSSSSWDTYGYLYDANKSQLASDDESGGNGDFKITRALTAGTLYYVKPAGWRSSGTLTFHVDGAMPTAGGKYESAWVLQATARNSFGRALDLEISLKSGELKGGEEVVYTLSATDHLGNTTTIDTVPIKVYSADDIVLNCQGGMTDKIKLSGHGEEFDASATDSFGQPCEITFETADGQPITAGQVQDIYVVATDKAGNVKKSELISGISVYGMPTVTLHPEFVTDATDLSSNSFDFDVQDSFGEGLSFEITVQGTQANGEHIDVTLTASDDAGNTLTVTYHYVVGHLEHVLKDEWIEDSEASCTAKGHRHKECEVCGYHMAEEDYGEMLPHEWEENLTADNHKKCSICGTEETLYEERDGKIYFGEYPQTKETDNGITATLAQMSGNRPVRGNSGEWTDYGYYINGSTSEYMWYIDLKYGEDRYRGVYFTSYRPYYTTTSSGNTYQDDNGYYTNTLYWFKWEPIEWRVLEKEDGEAFLMSNVILDSQQYYRTASGYTRTIDGKTVYENNYKESDIRAWLNGTFYNWAFDEFEQAIINETLVDNSASTTSSSSNSHACENTNDKVFLLSYKDVLNTSYGFNSSSGNYDTARRLKTTGYAQSQGAYTSTDSSYRGNGWWWLRSPSHDSSGYALNVGHYGDAGGYNVYSTGDGVVPAIKIWL